VPRHTLRNITRVRARLTTDIRAPSRPPRSFGLPVAAAAADPAEASAKRAAREERFASKGGIAAASAAAPPDPEFEAKKKARAERFAATAAA
jgi:hypothetical protein